MPTLLKDGSIIAKFKVFFEDNYKSDLETIALTYPDTRSLIVDYLLLDQKYPDLAEKLLKDPYKIIFNAKEAIKQIDTVNGNLDLHIRFKNLAQLWAAIPINKIRAKHISLFAAVEGFVRKTTKDKRKYVVAAFQCSKCGAVIRVEQDEDLLKEPSVCYADQGGCDRAAHFKLLPNLSQFIDFQKVELQEPPELARDGEQPERIVVYLEDDLVKTIIPGDRVIITGILQTKSERRGTLKLLTMDTVMAAYHIEIRKSSFENINITQEDIKLMKKISKQKKLFINFRGSIAPSVYGYENIKDAIVLQLFGSDNVVLEDGTFRRGDSHFLLVGDPGTAKSILLEATYKLAIRGIMIEGPSSTGAGLTAVAVKDDFGDGQWTIEAGALPMADRGFACIDEFDKMDEEDRNKIHRAMEQQKITVSKAGLNVTLNARCAILAASNPAEGNFNVFEPLHGQINLPSTILSRFDGVFAVVDKVDKEKDAETAIHMINIRRDPESIKPKFDSGFIRKYIAYAKQHCHPIISDDIVDIIKDYYIKLRVEHTDEDIKITPRQLDTIIRLSMASARVRLSDMVMVEDVERAKTVFNSSLGTMERSSLEINHETVRR